MLANQALNLRSLPTRGARARLRQRFLERQKAADIQLDPALLFPRNRGRIFLADHGVLCVRSLGHGRAPVAAAPCQRRSLAGQEHGRTMPFAEVYLVNIVPRKRTRNLEPTILKTCSRECHG